MTGDPLLELLRAQRCTDLSRVEYWRSKLGRRPRVMLLRIKGCSTLVASGEHEWALVPEHLVSWEQFRPMSVLEAHAFNPKLFATLAAWFKQFA
jgi:hypothetical protein